MSKFNKLADALAQNPNVYNPRGLAYALGVKRYGKRKMRLAAKRGVPVSRVR